MALNGLFCADVPLRNYPLTHSDFLPIPLYRIAISIIIDMYIVNSK